MASDDYPDSPSTTAYLPAGGSVTGTLETAGDADWFRLDLDPDRAYLFSARMADGSEPIITVWNVKAGTVLYTTQLGGLYTDELVNPYVPYGDTVIYASVPQLADGYYLAVSGPRTGAYTVGMRTAPDDHGNLPASAQLLGPGAPAAARFDYAFDHDQFRIAGVAGNAYTVTISTDDGTLGAAERLHLMLDGDRYKSASGGATVSYRFLADSTRDYFIDASMMSYGPPAAGGMPYHVSVTVTDGMGPRALSLGGSVDGAIRVTFDETLRLASYGSITLLDERGVSVEQWTIAGGAGVHVDGQVLTLAPQHLRTLMPGKYSLYYSSGTLLDVYGNPAPSAPPTGAAVLDKTSAGGLALAGKADGARLQGGAGAADTVVYAGLARDYLVGQDGAGFKVSAAGGTRADSLSGFERIVFTQGGDALALSLDGQLGQAYRLYRAAFDRAPDKGGLGFWLHQAESGVGLAAMARGFIDSKEFVDLYGNHPDDAAFVASLYRNVLHREGDSGGAAFWRDALAKGVDRAEVLAAVSESAENQEQVAGLVGNGIAYTPYG